jgi:hypothetical protein
MDRTIFKFVPWDVWAALAVAAMVLNSCGLQSVATVKDRAGCVSSLGLHRHDSEQASLPRLKYHRWHVSLPVLSVDGPAWLQLSFRRVGIASRIFRLIAHMRLPFSQIALYTATVADLACWANAAALAR